MIPQCRWTPQTLSIKTSPGTSAWSTRPDAPRWREFSCELGIGHSTLRNILHGQGNSTLGTVEQIAQNLGVAPQVLLTGQHTEDRLLSALLLLEAVDCLKPLDPGQQRQASILLSQLLELLPPSRPRSRFIE